MVKSSATVPTEHARRYMIQLCKHFGHKVETRFDDHEGRIRFEMGEAKLRARPEALLLVVETEGEEALARLEGVVASHLQRFAFRENELSVDWRRGAAPAA
ncbi:DUF2218 domain-containing protein [Phenylobacterium sp.]|jgi:hypothetical protein|uniref:DUF2218 domain-containing protein n=1 Tax=Phenylobacterium sp. TaxID=1871053 RepID=UPI0008B70DBA|nr:DUF2218 domain-containing protein [Phenylobacterium sp.]MBC7168991.1 DUF2218 domain-containing protein [Phenylobacterium sp.]OHB36691.1 MAG: hypothetical protein A2882_08560 [Phenylobacterium sp. RIFCSPHIGHO2_01_FULL_70_10]